MASVAILSSKVGAYNPLLASTSALLKETWSQPNAKVQHLVPPNQGEMVSWIKNCGPYQHSCYLNPFDNTLCLQKDGTLRKVVSPTNNMVGMDFIYSQIAIAHYSLQKRCFTVSVADSTEGTWIERASPIHLFPLLGTFFYDSDTIMSLSSDGMLSVMKGESVDYIDTGYHALLYRNVDDKLFIVTMEGICVWDIPTRRRIDQIVMKWDSPPTSFFVHRDDASHCRMIIAFVDGSVSRMCYSFDTKQHELKTYWKSTPRYHVLDSYIDSYKCVLACSDGSLRLGDSETLKRWYELYHVFDPKYFKRMQVTHQKIYTDGTWGGVQVRNWFHGDPHLSKKHNKYSYRDASRHANQNDDQREDPCSNNE